jgi:hypothetical protein
MTNFNFTLRLNCEISSEMAEALYEAGCADAGIETGPAGTLIEFERDASDWAHAIGSAIREVEKLPNLMVAGAGQDDRVTALDIADRAGCTREAVRLWAIGRRGPGGFPAPEWTSPSGERFWSWAKVARWLNDRHGITVDTEPDEIRWVDAILTARRAAVEVQLALADAPEPFRREFALILGTAA